ncbi:MAG TPA: arsenate reductase [Casimicrobiaceae bacterium]|nr:arsenate reductase [Casimicrobiaceae bacterium]
MKLYGITNCSTVKKARAWLEQHGVDYDFVDFKKAPPSRSQLASWVKKLGWETVLNRRGNTWRMLGPDVQQRVGDANSAIDVMLANPSAIKRPVIDTGDDLLIGFAEAEYASHFAGDKKHARAS